MMKLKEEDMALNVQQDNVSRHAEALQKRERNMNSSYWKLLATNKTRSFATKVWSTKSISYFKIVQLVLNANFLDFILVFIF